MDVAANCPVACCGDFPSRPWDALAPGLWYTVASQAPAVSRLQRWLSHNVGCLHCQQPLGRAQSHRRTVSRNRGKMSEKSHARCGSKADFWRSANPSQADEANDRPAQRARLRKRMSDEEVR